MPSRLPEDAYASEGGTNLKGSVFWMAPEVIRNMGRGYSAKVDIWSLGCLVLEMFAGRRPWGEDSVLTTMFSVSSPFAAALFLWLISHIFTGWSTQQKTPSPR